MLFVALISIVGFMFVHRISRVLIHHSLFSESELTKIGTVSFACMIALLMTLPRSHFTAWIAVIIPMFVAGICLAVAVKKRSTIFRTRFIEVLTHVLLKMKSGRSFRQSLLEVTSESDPLMRAKLSEINSVVAFSQQRSRTSADQFVIEVIDELILADRQPHAAMKRLTVFRDKLRIEDDFRRRSGQVLSRVRAQSFVMCGLYVAIFLFMIWKFGWRVNSDLMMASFFLFSAGALWIWTSGRRLKWKV